MLYLADLVRELVGRDLKLRYKRSVLGFGWSLLNPLLQLLVLSVVFQWVLPLNIDHYVVFLFSGLLVWNWFSGALHAGTSVVVDNGDLVRHPGFPVLLLPLVSVTSHWLHFLLALPVLGVFLFAAGILPGWPLLALPGVMLVQFAFTLSLAYLLAAIHVFFRDTQYLLGVALLLGFYVSSVFYDISSVPPRFQDLFRLNPIALLIDAYRAILLRGQFPSALPLLALFGVALLLITCGAAGFYRASYQFAEEL
jgi:lipopolysaccharide transport system permease protein